MVDDQSKYHGADINPDHLDDGFQVQQDLNLIRVNTVQVFIDFTRQQRKMMMPYWYRNNDGTMAFDYINSRTDKDQLKKEIAEGRIYIRKPGSTMKVTETKR